MKSNYVFLGFLIPEEVMEQVLLEDKLPQIQTHKFIGNFVKTIEQSNDIELTFISSRPVSDFPYYKKKVIKKAEWECIVNNKKRRIIELPFINTFIFKIFSRFISSFFVTFKRLYEVKSSGIIVYSVHLPFMLSGVILSKMFSIPVIALWTDPPSISNKLDSKLKNNFRKIELQISKYLMSKFDRVISLTPSLGSDFNKNDIYVLEGIVDVEEYNKFSKFKNKKHSRSNTKFVYTGSIEKRYGIENIVKAFSSIDDQRITLDVYGTGDYTDELIEVARVRSNINYHGFISPKLIPEIQCNADVLLNARSNDDDYVKYSFPSKMMEYMSSGTPLLSTILSGFPPDYREYMYHLDDNSPSTIRKKVIELSLLDKDKLELTGFNARRFMRRKCSDMIFIPLVKFINK